MSYDHDYPDDGVHEATFMIDDKLICVSKVGGGTIGRAYEGHWHYAVFEASGGPELCHGSDFGCTAPMPHQDVALELHALEVWVPEEDRL